ncbi:Nmad5 family putative nucleotide modification protein [Robbsia andropogonis]|uniref:Nmad5 family putative nucleotide modification protein n=1 Tax=Robbsia andropogonis TaxID=28092 RepID=UPI00209D7D66|nr:Nmad5 family putative nucleotide modification protein [Robbsia andropogonis]MCP1118901.1 Nmad5 family putative nucleotide modification protein [Robbsia andropogonis]MCP1128368.1 Nmad5 family putative nucleotide modification protein [Robbsia andropogonis]
MSKVLTRELREQITKHCVSATFKKREEAHVKAKQKFACDLRQHEFGADLKLIAKLPDHWFSKNSSISVRSSYLHMSYRSEPGKLNYQMQFGAVLPMPYRAPHGQHEAIVDDAHPLVDRLIALAKEEQAIHDDKTSLESKLTGLLFSCRTLKSLRETWPEGKKFIPDEPVPVGAAIVPHETKKAINQMMGLASA